MPKNHRELKFILKLGGGKIDKLISYVELNDIISDMIDDKKANSDHPFLCKGITEHAGPFSSKHKHCKGSTWNVKVLWEDGSHTWEPLNIMAKDDPITCAQHAKDHGLLDTAGWKSLKQIANHHKKFQRQVKQHKAHQKKHTPKFKFGVEIPAN